MTENFIAHGSYTFCNAGGFLVQISDCGSMARTKDAFGSDNPEISDWLEIVYVEDKDNPNECIPVIEPEGRNIPLNQVIKI